MRPVTLTAAHLPVEVRGLLEEFHAAHVTTTGLEKRLAVASGTERAELEEQHERAVAASTAAYGVLEAATRDFAPQMRQSSASAFYGAVERARALIAEAEAELCNAASAAALHASVRDGKTCVSADTERAARSKSRQHVMRNVSGLRDVLGDLPGGIDG